jgi:UDP-glucose 4-epimerase
MSFTNKKILIVGSNGYLGSNTAYQLLEYGADVRLADISETSLVPTDRYSQIDFSDSAGIREVLEGVDIVFFFAGKTGDAQIGFNEPDQFIIVNEITLVNLLNVIKDFRKKPKIIFPSTRLIYKGSDLPITENSELVPKSVYSVNKLACENYLRIYSDCYGIDYTIFRISLPYGSIVDQQRISYGVMSFLVNLAQKKQPLKIFGQGNQIGSLIHIQDLVEILIHGGLLEQTNNETFNVGGPDHLEMGQVVRLIAGTFDVPVIHVEWPEISKKTDQGNLIFDSTKIVELMNYRYKNNFLGWLNQVKQ